MAESLTKDDQPRRVPLLARWRGPDTKEAARKRTEMTARLSKECGWAKPIIKLPMKDRQS